MRPVQPIVAGARAAGLSVGLYFYSQAVTEEEATEEAEFIVQAARTCRHVTAPLVITGGYTVDLAGRAEGVEPGRTNDIYKKHFAGKYMKTE